MYKLYSNQDLINIFIFMKKILLILIIALSIDIILSNLILKKTRYLKNVAWEKKWWRVPSKVYHHDILPNTDQFEIWGG